ncbi:MAG: HD domain-containing protein [Promethearchaeota archaeon]|nr:MAG: HD domain-containing protein [Candidatus Lokiarchaeota archaeon]
MVDQNNFEEIIVNLTTKSTLNRVDSISDGSVRIIRIDKENGLFEAEIQGNTLIPYKLSINILQNNIYESIYHDCPDYLARKKLNNKFCKHILKFFYVLRKQDNNLALNLLQELNSKIEIEKKEKNIDLLDLNHFVNTQLKNQLDFKYKGFDYFFEICGLEDTAKDCIKGILVEAKKLPAAIRGFHGAYEGGLFDHILLVTNYAYNLSKSMDLNVDVKKAVLTAIYHDFGKISYYSFKKENFTSKVVVDRKELDIVHEDIVRKFRYEGRHYHVEEAIAVLKRNSHILFFDDEMYQAIIFHHGQWSKYFPIDMNELAILIHKADMIASQTHFI